MKGEWAYCAEVFSKKQCEEIVHLVNTLPLQRETASIGYNKKINTSIRRTTISWITLGKFPEFKFLEDQLWDFMHHVNKEVFNFDVNGLQNLQFTEYDAKYFSEYKSHQDIRWITPDNIHRKISISLQLTDPSTYDGGDLILQSVMDKPDPALIKMQGTLIAFNSFVVHKVTPVTRGVRNSIVAWFTGPYFR